MSIESVMLSNQLIVCHPLFLLPSNFPSIRVFSKELICPIKIDLSYPLFISILFTSVLVSVQLLSHVYLQPHEPQHARPPCPSSAPSLLKLMSIESVMPSNHLILCRPLLLPPSIFPSIRVFSSESVSSHEVTKVLEFQLQHQSFQ